MNLRSMINFIVLVAALATTSPSHAQQRQRPIISSGFGYRIIFTDQGTLHRGVSLAWDGGDPYGSLPKNIPTSKQLERLSREFGLNTLHLYLEGNSSKNPNPPGINATDADALVREEEVILDLGRPHHRSRRRAEGELHVGEVLGDGLGAHHIVRDFECCFL